MTVRNILMYPSVDVGTLCSNEHINPFARYRPGYWKYDGTYVVFQPPRGGAYTDPRGSDSDTGINVEAYNLGHFRQYNHDALPFGPANKIENIIVPSDMSTLDKLDYRIGFNIGEVDWKGTETKFRGKNNLPGTFTHVAARCMALQTSGNHGMIGREIIPTTTLGGDYSVELMVQIPVPAYANTTQSYTIEFGLSTGNSALFGKFKNSDMVINISKRGQPMCSLLIPDTTYPAINSRMQGFLAQDRSIPIYEMIVDGGISDIAINNTTARITKMAFTIYKKNSTTGREAYYQIISPKWAVSGYVQEWDSIRQTEIKRASFSTTLSGTAEGLFDGNFQLGMMARQDYVYNIFITDCGTGNVTLQS